MHLLDITGAALSLTATFLFVKASPKAWPVSLLAIMLNTKLYFEREIIGQALLEVYYLFSCIYGWIGWKGLKQSEPLSITYLKPMHYTWLIGCAAILFLMSFFFITAPLASISPKADAFIVALSILAQWMLCRKLIECWAMWFIVDLAVALLHFDKGLPFHSLQHFIYLAFAIAGYIKWHQVYKTYPQDKLAFS